MHMPSDCNISEPRVLSRRELLRTSIPVRTKIACMSLERFRSLQARLLEFAERAPAVPRAADDAQAALAPGSRLTRMAARELFASQLTSRHLDRVAYELRARGEGFYTISSAGHE